MCYLWGKMEECKLCRTWEEEMYWKHFNTFHFTQLLPPEFHDRLVLPKKFAHHMKSQLPDKVSLKGPSGAEWEIELLKTDDILFVGNEWKDFVKAHDLKENCRLMFKFRRNSSFEVIIFEQGGFCEKETAYFVKKCRHFQSDCDQRKRTNGDVSTEIIENEGEEDSTFLVSKKSRRDEGEEDSTFLVAKKSRRVGVEVKAKTQTTRRRISYTAMKRRGRSGRVQVRHKPIVQSGKGSFRNQTQEVPITPEEGGNSPRNDHSKKLETHSKENLNRIDIAEEIITQVTREVLTSENGHSQAVDCSHRSNSQPEKQPNGDHNVTPSQVLERGLNTPLNGESNQVSDHRNELEAQSEKETGGNDTAKELTQNSGRVLRRPNYSESSLEEDHTPKPSGKRGRPKKQALSKSSKKLVLKIGRVPKEYMSNRRPVSEKEKGEAFQRATKRETEHSFTAILPPTSVYKRFYLSVPGKWLCEHLLHRSQEVILRVGEKTWSTTLFYQGKRGGGFSAGWKKFALDNNLEEFDVLVFTLSSQKDTTPVLMDVEIFRVVSTTVPPFPVVS